MKLSYEWLNEFVDLSGIGVQEFADRLSLGAFEVEEVRSFGPDIEGPVVTGEIMEIMPHPNADKIRLTRTRVAEGEEPQEIVCGATNIEVGQRIPVALPGARVINRHDGTPLAIKQSKIRGVVSNGMLCSAPELGVTGSSEGILVLGADIGLGLDIKELLHLKKDWILHVSPRSNRGDALCVLGLAREASALFKRPLKQQALAGELEQALRNFAAEQSDVEKTHVAVSIENNTDCPFFSARVIHNVQIGPSPALIARRLEALGLRPVNNVVDITNYVLQELGQPLHAYDLALLKGAVLNVRRARGGESLMTIDGKERSLPEEALVIADAGGVVGVAGVMGGKYSEISDSTTTLALEAASFNSARVRRSSRLLGLSSDSSLRFERGVDIASVQVASNRAAYLIAKHCGGKIGEMSTAGDDKVPDRPVQMRLAELARLAEINIVADDVGVMMEPLGFTVCIHADDYNAGIVNVLVPSFRQGDVSREIDVIEEICRLYGYDRIKPSMPERTMAAPPRDRFHANIRNSLSASGLSEAWLSSLTGRDDLDARGSCKVADESLVVSVLNPLSPDHQVLRQRLVPGLLKAAVYNQDRGRDDVSLFEIGRAYFRERETKAPVGVPDEKHVPAREEIRVAGIMTEEPVMSIWKQVASNDSTTNFFHLKGVVENLLERLSISLDEVVFEQCSTDDWYHPGRTCALYARVSAPSVQNEKPSGDGNGDHRPSVDNKVFVGIMGEIHPQVCRSYKLKGRPVAFELNVELLRSLSRAAGLRETSATPSVIRDLTIDLATAVAHSSVHSCIADAADDTLRRIDLVSVFDLSEGHKSLSYRLTLQHPKETLTAEKVDGTLVEIRKALSEKLNASFRI